MLFDLMQVTLSLSAAYCLGFIVTSDHYGLSAYAFTNGAVLVICLVSLAFGDFEPIRRLRKMGVALSGLAPSCPCGLAAPEQRASGFL